MKFVVVYPVFAITKGDDLALVKVRHESAEAMADAVAIFTDEDAAKSFLEEHFPGWRLAAFPNEDHFARLLTALRASIFLVAFDPYRMATRPATIPLNALLEQMSGQ
jgi:hypothetical protein